MNQTGKLTRARQLAGSVWPGRAVDGYTNLIVARLRKLSAAKSTGMLPFSGHGEGGIFLRDGRVVYAESTRTPGCREGGLAALGLDPAAPPDPATRVGLPGPPNGAPHAFGRIAAGLAAAEATIDASLDLLATESRYAKFRPGEMPSAGQFCDIGLETLLGEIERRRRVFRQLASVVTADTTVVRDPQMSSPSLQVSSLQWSLLLRVRGGATPRGLAMELCRGVFGTTIEVYRLIVLGLLSAPTPPTLPGPPTHPGPSGQRKPNGPAAMSFIRAVSDER